MDKASYLEHGDVAGLLDYLACQLQGKEAPLHHRFVVRDKALGENVKMRLRNGILEIQSLQDAFEAYWWDGEDFESNHRTLSDVRKSIREAIAHDETPERDEWALDAVKKVLEWGAGGKGPGLYRKNVDWAERQKKQGTLAYVLKAGRTALSAETADPNVFCGSQGIGPRMNAGFTKYYALAADDLIIYDGRVGAALGLLVRKYCEKTGQQAVPDALHFRWGAQYSLKPGEGLNRDPSMGSLVFKPLRTSGGAQWAAQMLRASWILEAARELSGAQWCAGMDGLRRIEAGLFTMGYSMEQAE